MDGGILFKGRGKNEIPSFCGSSSTGVGRSTCGGAEFIGIYYSDPGSCSYDPISQVCAKQFGSDHGLAKFDRSFTVKARRQGSRRDRR